MATHSEPISALIADSTLHLPSSVELGWQGLAIERRTLAPRERAQIVLDHHYLILWEARPAVGERVGGNGRFAPYRKIPGTITTCVPGIAPAVRNRQTHQAVICAVNPAYLAGIEAEFDQQPPGTLHELYGSEDAALRNLLLLLLREAAAGGPNGRLYSDSLGHALAARLAHAGRSARPSAPAKISGLPRHTLRRVLERMQTDFHTGLSLSVLAAETGYSRSHFIRMFRAATGRTPHRFLLDYRLEKSQALLAAGSLPLSAVALNCGFASQAHFAAAFRARYGATPGEFRRQTTVKPRTTPATEPSAHHSR